MTKKVILLIFLLANFILAHGTTSTKNYIIYMGEHSFTSTVDVISANHAMLTSIIGSDVGVKESVIQHYTKSFRGFSAMLTLEQAQQLGESEEVISVFESKTVKLHSTHSWDFMGLKIHGGIKESIDVGSDIIIGHIDTGVWPESESFNDTGLGPVPKRFKGECVTGQNFTLANCNRKIIGARYYFQGLEADGGPLESYKFPFFRSARAEWGHGSHTASTAAGAMTPYSSLLGMAAGHARGGAPGARIAVYKPCWFGYCNYADIFSAFDDAVADGVDIISISVGPGSPQTSYFLDPINIGSFHAFQKGILVSASVGNQGGAYATAVNVAPWILTVAASFIDRTFESNVTLGNSKVVKGTSLNPKKLEGNYGIISGSAAAVPSIPTANASYCQNNTLNHTMVAGKIVVCTLEAGNLNPPLKSAVVKQSGGVGMILVDPAFDGEAMQFAIPTVVVGEAEASQLYSYLNSERNPIGNISKTTTVVGESEAPEMAAFSSVGPNLVTPDIIKPDITAPGVNILAAWSPAAPTYNGRVKYNIISGTSMACPHVSGAAAFVWSHHPKWSPAAVMSALITTANVLDNRQAPIKRNGSSATPFDYGSGHLNPHAALNPSLVYDFSPKDIIHFLCSNGTNPGGFKNLTGNSLRCKEPHAPTHDLNYPSIGVADINGIMTVHRTLTNVLDGHRFYDVLVEAPNQVLVHVVPNRLEFSTAGEKKSFRVELVPLELTNGTFVFGSITWTDSTHTVRSPMALKVTDLVELGKV